MDKVTPGQQIYWIDARTRQTKNEIAIYRFTILLLLLYILIISYIRFIETENKQSLKVEESHRVEVGAATVAPTSSTVRYAPRVISAKEKSYIDRFKEVAKVENQKYDIPVSIKLAQGLLESNKGSSTLAKKANNHFGVKENGSGVSYYGCNSKGKDCARYKVYESAWASYRDHSIRLSGKRYKHLKKHGNDYRSWAHGLKEAGYATDSQYANKLIRLIEELSLYRYDST
jgi:flagellum-specific peptidoglycan hydrolase FlgJ